MSSQYGELWPTNGWDRLAGLGHPTKFQRVSSLGFVTAPTSLNGSQPNFALCLAVSLTGTLYIHFRALLPPNGIFQVQSSLCVQVLHSPILAALLHGTRAVGVSQTLRRLADGTTYIRQGGHHVGHRPTFYSSEILPLLQRTPLPITFRSYSVSKRHLKLQATCAFPFMCKHIVINSAVFLEVWEKETFQTAKVTFKVTQGHCHWCHSIGHMWFSVSLSLQLRMFLESSLYRSRDIISYKYFPKSKEHILSGMIFHACTSSHEYKLAHQIRNA